MALDFYHGHGSPYSWRVWLALEHRRIPYEVKVLSFQAGDTKKPEFVAINPRHQVPTIVDEGFALWESTVILEYLDERDAPGPKLYPGGIKEKALARRLVREAEEYLYREAVDRIVDELFWKGEEPADMNKIVQWRERVQEELAYFEKSLRGRWLMGEELTAADIVLYVNIAYCKRITVRKPEARLTEVIPPRLAEWAARFEALPYFDKTFPPHWR